MHFQIKDVSMGFLMKMVFAKTARYMWIKIVYHVTTGLHVTSARLVSLQMIGCAYLVRIDLGIIVMNVQLVVVQSARLLSLLVMDSAWTVDL